MAKIQVKMKSQSASGLGQFVGQLEDIIASLPESKVEQLSDPVIDWAKRASASNLKSVMNNEISSMLIHATLEEAFKNDESIFTELNPRVAKRLQDAGLGDYIYDENY